MEVKEAKIGEARGTVSGGVRGAAITSWPPLWPPLDSLQVVPLDVIGTLTPSEVLYEFEGPCIFTARAAHGVAVLAYLSEDLEDEQRLRYIVATTSEGTVDELKHGVISVREALDRGSLWMVDFDYGYRPVRAFSVRSEQLPEDAMPLRGTMLLARTRADGGLLARARAARARADGEARGIVPGVGVAVGRFQTPYLHKGHKILLNEVNYHAVGIVFVGVPGTPMTKKNPLDFVSRKLMIQEFVGPHVTVLPIHDHPNDDTWSKNLDRMIESIATFQKVSFYHGRDSFKPHYSGKFDNFIELKNIDGVDATSIRNNCKTKPRGTEDFRLGVVYASQNMFPRVQPTVDIACVATSPKGVTEVLLARKPGNKSWCFVGGFVDMADQNLEMAAARELYEETNIKVHADNLSYVGSFKVNDWRDTVNTSIMTTFYVAENHVFSNYKPQDDIEELGWFDIENVQYEMLGPGHQILLSALKAYLRKKKKNL